MNRRQLLLGSAAVFVATVLPKIAAATVWEREFVGLTFRSQTDRYVYSLIGARLIDLAAQKDSEAWLAFLRGGEPADA